ncbi:M48 family metallopeptidase [Subdoligranulum sp. DSM 109015]|uniref:M48 family metallopeptidase n=1 Tax=Gemmiger gallinarum TaxID=2779354 RepID=A0ABR9R5E4_9FIRM|nr:M48 family metallopeptidase [Gemmiger gallinarum]
MVAVFCRPLPRPHACRAGARHAHPLGQLQPAHPDHSPAFWAKVARLLPDYAARRAMLRTGETR